MVVRTRLDLLMDDSGSMVPPSLQSGYPLLNSRGLRRWPLIISSICLPYGYIISSMGCMMGLGWGMIVVLRSIIYMLFLFRFSVNNLLACHLVYLCYSVYILFRILIDYLICCLCVFLYRGTGVISSVV